MPNLDISIRPDFIATGTSAPILYVTLPNGAQLQTPVTVSDLEWVVARVQQGFGIDARHALKTEIAERVATENYRRWMSQFPEAVEEWAAFEIETAKAEAAIVSLDEVLAELDADRVADEPVYLPQAAE